MSAKTENQTTSPQAEEKIKPKYKILVVDPRRCDGCETCESVCSMVHDNEFNPLNSRIHRVRIEPIINFAMNCQLCEDRFCIEACQPKALSTDEETGLLKVNENKCDGCAACVKACPYGAIVVHTKKNKAIVCDLCRDTEEGTPQCIEYCPKDAIFLFEIDPNEKMDPVERILKIIEEGFPEIDYGEESIIKRTPDLN
ncbi:MAG: 4Fe-4S dicluster domain-containing protein [Candidatus Helarchaeota archaeon]